MKLLIALLMTLNFSLFAHEGGHGSLSEGGKFGGITAPIVDKTEAGKGDHAKTLYKAELVRAASGKLSLYIFDNKMNLMDLSTFGAEVEAKLEAKKKGKFTYFGDFKFKKAGNHFEAQLPQVEYKPFNIDLFLTKGTQKLFVGFSNLD
ncbi:hypothetical protein ACJVC5_15005 [Peredibacter sp. HCB2-198]|uniref:hypothetical protein n=1 Tax=Peredibacter sp. HCB2-198 TaxID=3383025 RepID=UPI0038B4F7C3